MTTSVLGQLGTWILKYQVGFSPSLNRTGSSIPPKKTSTKITITTPGLHVSNKAEYAFVAGSKIVPTWISAASSATMWLKGKDTLIYKQLDKEKLAIKT